MTTKKMLLFSLVALATIEIVPAQFGMNAGWGAAPVGFGLPQMGLGTGRMAGPSSFAADVTRKDQILSGCSVGTPVTMKISISPGRGMGWLLGGGQSGLSATVDISPGKVSGDFSLIATERAFVEKGCTAQKLGSILPVSNNHIQSNLLFGVRDANKMVVLREVKLTAGKDSNLRLDNIPYDRLDYLAGRGIALCGRITTDAAGREECDDKSIIPACLKLGYDQDD